MELNGAKILYTIHTNIPVLGDFKITQTLVSTWIVMALLSALAFWLGRDLKLENVSKRQAAAEFIVERLDQFVHDNMGWHFDKFIPLVGAIFALSIGCNLISVVGLWSPTADLMTELGWALVVFVLITYHKIKASGIGGYLKGFLDPIFVMAPINVMSELFTPISMACRHFGNILSGTVISALIYGSLTAASYALFGALGSNRIIVIAIAVVGGLMIFFGKKKGKKKLFLFGIVFAVLGVLGLLTSFGGVFAKFPWLTVGLPAITSFYFDWFSGCIQAFIFCTLTTIFIKQAAG